MTYLSLLIFAILFSYCVGNCDLVTHAEPVVNVSYTSLTRKEKKNRSVRTGRYCFFGNEPYMQSIFDTPYRDVVPPCNPVRIMTLKLSGGAVTVGISF